MKGETWGSNHRHGILQKIPLPLVFLLNPLIVIKSIQLLIVFIHNRIEMKHYKHQCKNS